MELPQAAPADPGPAGRTDKTAPTGASARTIGAGQTWPELEEDIFSEEFLLTRPLLEAITPSDPVVLLVDEIDRVELETEALLLEVLSDYQVSIPELGTVRAKRIPLVFLTSNGTRELSEALKRRCLYLHLDYPTARARAGHRAAARARASPSSSPTRSRASCARCATSS